MSNELKRYVVVYKVGLVPQIKVLEVEAANRCDAVVNVVNGVPYSVYEIVSVKRVKE